MAKIDSGMVNDSNVKIYYEICDDGFDIFFGDSETPSWSQHEPYIPYKGLSYEENAKKMCESLNVNYSNVPTEPTDESIPTYKEIRSLRSDLDYLMLLNDPDSAAEATE